MTSFIDFIGSGRLGCSPARSSTAHRSRQVLVGSDDAWNDHQRRTPALPKKGRHSAGVLRHNTPPRLGRLANCQSLVSVTLASREVPVMVGLRLFLPETWTDDPERMTRAHVPKDRQTALTKPEIAIEEIDRVIASGARFGGTCRMQDTDSSVAFPPGFERARPAMGSGFIATPERLPSGRCPDLPPRKNWESAAKYHIPDRSPVSAEAMLAGEKWQKVSWRRGTKGTTADMSLRSLPCPGKLRMAISTACSIIRMQCMPRRRGLARRLERLSTGERKYYVSNLPADAAIKMLVAR